MNKALSYFQTVYPDCASLLTGNGTTGLYIAFQALGIQNRHIAIPNNVCFNVPLAVLYSGNIPLYGEIDQQTLGLSYEFLEKCDKSLAAVVAVHGYGNGCDIQEIEVFCKENNIPLIEDCAVAQGARVNGRLVGSFGDVSVFSFGAGKIVQAGHGGACLIKDPSLFREMSRITGHLPPHSQEKDASVKSLSQFHTQTYNRYYLNGRPESCACFGQEAGSRFSDHIFQFNPRYETTIEAGLEGIHRNLSRRRSNTEKLRRRLSKENLNVIIPPVRDESAPWRFNLFLKTGRNRIFNRLLASGFKISSWHPSVDVFFQDRKHSDVDTPVSDWVGEHILNIWIDQEIDDDYLKAVSEAIAQLCRIPT